MIALPDGLVPKRFVKRLEADGVEPKVARRRGARLSLLLFTAGVVGGGCVAAYLYSSSDDSTDRAVAICVGLLVALSLPMMAGMQVATTWSTGRLLGVVVVALGLPLLAFFALGTVAVFIALVVDFLVLAALPPWVHAPGDG